MKQVYCETFEDNLEHDYNIIDEGKDSHLFRSNDSNWAEHAKGGLALTLHNTGDGYKIKFPDQKLIQLDYAAARELLVLLLNDNDSALEIRESTTLIKI